MFTTFVRHLIREFLRLLTKIFSKMFFHNFHGTFLTVFFSQTTVSKSIIGYKIGHFLKILYYITFFVQFFKSLNRFMAVATPLQYRIYFSKNNAKFFIFSTVILSIIPGIIYFFENCNFYFKIKTFLWSFDFNECFLYMSFYIDFILCTIIVTIVVILDTITFSLIIKNSIMKKPKSNVMFFVQSCCTLFLHILSLIIFQLSVRIGLNNWWIFATTTLNWELFHTIDG